MRAPAAAQSEATTAARLVKVLGGAGAVAGLAIVTAFLATKPRIEANRARAVQAAIEEVLRQPDRYETLYVVNDRLAAQPPAGADASRLEQVYLGYRGATAIGFAVTAAEAGFQDLIHLIFGYDPATGTIIGMRVLDNRETPGLGDKIVRDSGFVAEFDSVVLPLRGVKAGQGQDSPGEVHMITGATISSRAVIRIINNRIQRLRPLLDAYRAARPEAR
ncbi:MAG TPA: FMN-binding protein [Gemmatimonadales bacterium]|nr:FMN-binding protein [Gemmatimonadales bacterium]